MPFLDNHMDDLFQRAAENFPLREPGNDWANIQSKLNTPATPAKTENHKKNKLLFGALAFLCMYLPYSLFDSGYLQEPHPFKAAPAIVNEQDKAGSESKDISNEAIATTAFIMPRKGNEGRLFNLTSTALKSTPVNKEIPEQYVEENTINKIQDTIQVTDHSPEPNNETAQHLVIPNKDEQNSNYDAPVQKQLGIESDSNHPKQDTEAPEKAKSTLKKPAKGWYAGIHSGVSMSLVKGQQLSSPGFTAGLTLGYRFTPSWSVETGITFSEKKYYSEGEYFSAKDMPPDMEIVSVQGRTLLWEIPLKAKYDFRKTANGQFFLSGGINTWIVGKEVNDYIIYRNGLNSPMHAVYPENQFNLAAIFEISGGYEKYLKNKQVIRIEPWIQIARKGIGVGQLPVSGFGVKAGYFFHK